MLEDKRCKRVRKQKNTILMNLTISDIEKDIAGFQNRIAKAKTELGELPKGYLPFKQHKYREKQQRDLQAEIEHVNTLIGYAREGIAIRQEDVNTYG